MRMLFLCNSPFWGGAEKYVVEIARGLVERGHRCWVAASPDSRLLAEVDDAEGVDGLTIDLGPKLATKTAAGMALGWPFYRRRIRALLDEAVRCFGIELVHLQFKKEQLLGTGVAGRLGLPVVWTEHDRLPAAIARVRPALELYRRIALQPRRILCASSFVREDLLARSIRHPALEVCHSGIAVTAPPSRAERALARRQFGFNTDHLVVGTTSRLLPIKGHHDLFNAAPALLECFPTLRLLIVGDGPARGSLETKAEQLGIRERVTFTGYRTDVRALLQVMDVYAAPSHGDGHPFSVLEAMAAERPIVGTRVGGIPEAVGEHAGLLVQPAHPAALSDALAALLADAGLRRQMGVAGRQRVLAKFTTAAMVDRTERAFRAALRPDLRIVPITPQTVDAVAVAS
jgi:glycosyltransferase involved in cell wall biosynthesis